MTIILVIATMMNTAIDNARILKVGTLMRFAIETQCIISVVNVKRTKQMPLNP